ncbi:exo-beta-1,3-glucanase (GH17 family) [Winogradskyella wandonensis]|uniref:Endo-1,3-beta-glucanase btgC n=1 Tax=Winogradskyella wandonensis TaxID=1442586 RepID=A0A4R1KR48_9FLAO|nr:glycosyl hydrolase family 17 protein [Winogradskyella wandonensis]TCK67504.1 exo-beta-1,3-glucanase (GH17 family) [Winogradskyella wandonensis]
MSYREESYYKSNYSQTQTVGIEISQYSLEDLKALWRKTIEDGMHGICFSMYEDGQEPGDDISFEQVERRVKILKPYTSAIRSFSCIEGNEHVPVAAKKHGLKTLVGAWLSDDKDDNEKEIEGLIALAKAGHVDVAAVGNEVLYRNDLSLEELIGYIKRVKEALSGLDIPVGYVDAYYEFSRHPELVENTDVILANLYPYWEGCPIDYALGHMQAMYGQVVDAAQGKPIIITETGWPSQGGSLKGAFAGEESAMKYFIDAMRWTKENDIPIFYFSSFDESWKTGDEGDVGAYWGLWDKHENLKF